MIGDGYNIFLIDLIFLTLKLCLTWRLIYIFFNIELDSLAFALRVLINWDCCLPLKIIAEKFHFGKYSTSK